MKPEQFPVWLAAWQKLRPVRRSYHLTCLLTGARPGELARTKWGDLDADTLTIGGGNLKAGNTVPSPLTAEIRAASRHRRQARRRRCADLGGVLASVAR